MGFLAFTTTFSGLFETEYQAGHLLHIMHSQPHNTTAVYAL